MARPDATDAKLDRDLADLKLLEIAPLLPRGAR